MTFYIQTCVNPFSRFSSRTPSLMSSNSETWVECIVLSGLYSEDIWWLCWRLDLAAIGVTALVAAFASSCGTAVRCPHCIACNFNRSHYSTPLCTGRSSVACKTAFFLSKIIQQVYFKSRIGRRALKCIVWFSYVLVVHNLKLKPILIDFIGRVIRNITVEVVRV
jgi:hypothetical protein